MWQFVAFQLFVSALTVGLSSATPLGLGPFSIITFQNKECSGTGTDGVIGTCLSSTECSERSGTAIGNCASGFGRCCVVRKTDCTSTISVNGSYIANPGFPANADSPALNCVYTIDVEDDICQVRLDFQDVVLTTAANGLVAGGTVSSITPSTSGAPAVSGELTGQHMYLEVTGNTNPTVTIAKPINFANDKWDIRVTQIECSSPWKAPAGCTQYFTELMGTISSYNSNCASAAYDLQTNAELDAQTMRICIRQAPGYSKVTYNAMQFGVGDLDGGMANVGFVGENTAGNFGCQVAASTMAQLIIPNNSDSGNDIFCGDRLAPVTPQAAAAIAATANAPIIQEAPFEITHNTGTHAAATATGFCLNYNQMA